jgi:ketosteroid isomerase-like protein
MSHENVGIVRSVYEAWARNELPGPAELLDPEIEYVNPLGAVEPGTRRGIEAFGQAVRAMVDGWETWEIQPERFVPAGEQVAVIVRYRVQGRVSGVDVNAHESALWTMRDGKVVRYEWFHRADDALEAVGLSG